MEQEGEEREEEKHCCISHKFAKAASRHPEKIAVIHASGGARICREHRWNIDRNNKDIDQSQLVSPPNPGFSGDESFTFSEVLAAVESLSCRIRRFLDGSEDSDLIRPTGFLFNKRTINDEISESPRIVKQIGQQSTEFRHDDSAPLVLGIYMVPSVEYIVAVLSVLRCGEAFLPLDPSWPKQRLLSIISSSNVALIVRCKSFFYASDSHRLEKSECMANESGCVVLEMSMKENHKKNLRSLDLVWPCESRRIRKFCYLIYTSGSTGKPKGVCGTEIGLLNRYLWMQDLLPLHTEEVLLFKTSISFIDHLQEFLSAILTCIPVVIPPFGEFQLNPFYIADFLKAYCVSRLIIVPSVMRAVLPAFQTPQNECVQSFLKVLLFSGEVLPVSLWDTLHKLFPKTSIINLYGSTEVSGDCTYFDCRVLPVLLETELLSSVPIGVPISNCDVILVEEPNETSEGEIYVGGACTSVGYFLDPTVTSLDYVKLPQVSDQYNNVQNLEKESRLYFRTGDFALRLHTGDLVFVGRKDRTLKVNGQRVALEEIENNLREYPDIVDVAVISSKSEGKSAWLIAFIVLKENKTLHVDDSQIRNWLAKRLPPAMLPNSYLCIESLPMTSSGKVDYAFLSDSAFLSRQLKSSIATECDSHMLQVIKEAFCDALMVGEIKNDDDFFDMGGNSIGAAQVAYKLGVDMRLLYIFPSPYKLLNALYDNKHAHDFPPRMKLDRETNPEAQNRNKLSASSLGIRPGTNDESLFRIKRLKDDPSMYTESNITTSRDNASWISCFSSSKACSFSRCNKVVYGGKYEANDVQEACWSIKCPRNKKGSVHKLWKVHMKSCVDASPLVVYKEGGVYLFIGSHSHEFLCVDAVSGFLRWEVKLEGRIECSAAIVDDFSQVVVGCYKGKIYFIDFMTGNIIWSFATQGEVKSQPVLDMDRKLIWCGSYDHNLYALDYKNHCCVYHISCGGSIYGSASINMVHNILFVASTAGRVTAILIEASPFRKMWMWELGAPVFGSLISSPNGNVVCCSVDGHVTVLSLSGSVVWKAITGGPIFAGACLSHALPSQVIVCCRNGSIYSFESERGDLLWEYNTGDPITSSAYVDENMQIISDPSYPPDRLICVCSSSGSLHVLRVNSNPTSLEMKDPATDGVSSNVQEFVKLDLYGDVFSSPVMISGRIFVGCRDDFVHCLEVEVSDHRDAS